VIAFRHHVRISTFLTEKRRGAKEATFRVYGINVINGILGDCFFSMTLRAEIIDATIVFNFCEKLQ
jgi:hypothetical protein